MLLFCLPPGNFAGSMRFNVDQAYALPKEEEEEAYTGTFLWRASLDRSAQRISLPMVSSPSPPP